MSEMNLFKVLAEKQRRDILVLLKNGRMNAGELAAALGVSPAALSYHLKLLKGADLVLEYRQKNYIYYEINTSVFDELILWVRQFGGGRNEETHVGDHSALGDRNGDRDPVSAGAGPDALRHGGQHRPLGQQV